VAAERDPWSRVSCVRGDLTRERVDAIVNAANETLRGGGGVDGAIHRAAGPELLAECVRLHPSGCPTGEVRVTSGHRLPSRYVIHAVGPVYESGLQGESELLASCFERALDAASELKLRSVSFPAISCGVYGYPWPEAAEVSLSAIARGLRKHESIESVRVVLFNDELLRTFETARAKLSSTSKR
jgi:O-acetyl-ADP-ribose deacetylase (regulator of RNase III)